MQRKHAQPNFMTGTIRRIIHTMHNEGNVKLKLF